MNRIGTLLKSKAVWGSIIAAAGWLVAQPAIGIVEVAQAVGAVLGVTGLRDAQTKLGATKE